MKIKLTFKDPDGVFDSVRDAVEAEASSIEGIDEDERVEIIEERHEKTMEAIRPWIEYGEYCRVEIDTEAGTAIVCNVRQ